MSDQKPTVGRTVHFAPPQDCVGPASLTLYPAIITQVKTIFAGDPGPHAGDPVDEERTVVDLVTFGPNSIYFQHAVQFSPEPKPGAWFWPPRV